MPKEIVKRDKTWRKENGSGKEGCVKRGRKGKNTRMKIEVRKRLNTRQEKRYMRKMEGCVYCLGSN